MTERTARERFGRPDPWHMPAAYWFWHHLPDEAQIRNQVAEMHMAGIHSFQVQARMAYPLEGYLDDDYLAACRIAVDEASQRGMIVGVYDDYSWQSGQAGGRAVAGRDELREQHLFWATGTIRDGRCEVSIDGITSSSESMGEAGMRWHYDDGVARWGEWTVRFAITGDARDIRHSTTIFEARDDGCGIVIDDPALADGSTVTVFVSARSTTSRLIDYMQRAAVERFLEVGYEPFHRELGDYFGSTVRYFFFDQPHANFYGWAQHSGDLASTMPWADDMVGLVMATWAEDYPRVLLSLLDASDPSELALRARFYDFYGSRQAELFLGTVHEWTRARGVLFTGHEVLAHVGRWELGGSFAGWDLRVNFGLDYFAIDSYRDLTSVDAQDVNPQLSAKMGDSVARSSGRSGTIVEQYFGTSHHAPGVYAGHWGLTLEELRAQTFRHHLLGMRQLLFHGFYQTDGFDGDLREYANPRFDFPPGENFEPWFAEHHGDFAIESGRLSEFLDGLAPACDVAILYPLRTVWVDSQGGPHAAEGGRWFESLARAGYGYHIVGERDLLGAHVSDGRLVLGERRYRCLVLPGARAAISSELLDALERFARAGVTIVASGATPEVYEWGAQTAREDWSRIREHVHELAIPPQEHELSALLGPPTLDSLGVTVDEGVSLWRSVGSTGTQTRAALFNDGTETVTARLSLPPGDAGIEIWPIDGSAPRAVLVQQGVASIAVGPQELVLCVTTPTPASATTTEQDAEGWSEPHPLDGTWWLTIPQNAHRYAGTRRSIDPARGWETQGLADFAGIGEYSTSILFDPGLEFRLELPAVAGSVTVSIEGVPVARRGWAPYLVDIADDSGAPVELVIAVASHAANHYYAGTPWREGPEPAGLLAVPTLRHRPKRGT